MNEREIFETAVEIPDPQRRAIFLDRACGGDAALRRRVDALLVSHEQAGGFLENSPVAGGNDATMRVIGAITAAESAPLPDPSVPHDSDDESSDPDETRSGDLRILLPSDKPGSIGRLGHYEVLEILGRGAFGIVFKAFDEKLHRLVAIKALSPELAATSPPRKRFLREARSVAAVKHDNIVQIYSVDEAPTPYLAMEFVDGRTLQQELSGAGPLDIPDILRLGQQMAAGLAAAHDKGLIHRDIKPGNILIEAGIDRRVKITDFGLARAADDATMTRTGMIAGTPMYMAPEQALGRSIDHRADLFSLGSVLYQMACGRPPFRGANAIAVLKRVVDEDPRPIRDILPDVPEWLCAIIDKLQAKSPDDRFASAKEVADLLGRCRSELELNGRVTCVTWRPRSVSGPAKGSTRPIPGSTNGSKPVPRRAAMVAAGLLLVGAIGLGITEATGVTSLFAKREPIASARRDSGPASPDETPRDIAEIDEASVDVNDAAPTSSPSPPSPRSSGTLLAALDPSRIPAAERFDWQPKELVAVIGSHARRMWNPSVSAAISPDGSRVAVTDQYRIAVWDFATGALLHEIESDRHVGRVEFGATADLLIAYVNGRPTMRRYDLSLDPPSVLEEVEFPNASAAGGGWLLEQGRTLLAVRFEQGFVLELHSREGNDSPDETAEGRVLRSVPLPIYHQFVAVADRIDRIVYRSADDRLRTADIVDGRFANDRELAIPLTTDWGMLGLTADGSRLLLRNDARIQWWELSDEPRLLIDRIGEAEGVPPDASALVSPDGRQAVLKYNQSLLYRLDDRTARFVERLDRTDGAGQFGTGAFSADGERLVIANQNGLVRWWKSDGAIPVEPTPLDYATAFASPKDDRTPAWDRERGRWLLPLIASPGPGGEQYRLWDLNASVPVEVGKIDLPVAAPIRKAAGDRFVALSSYPGYPIRLFGNDSTGFKADDRVRIGDDRLGNTSPDGRRLVLVAPAGAPERLEGWNLDRDLPEQAWSIEPSDKLLQSGERIWSVWFDDDGGRFATLAAGDEPGTSKLVLWNGEANPPEVIATLPIRSQIVWYRAALSNDGRRLAHTPDAPDEVVIVDLSGESPQELTRVRDERQIAAHFANLAFRPDGKRLAIGSQLGVTVVDLPSLRPVWAMRSPGAVEWLDWSTDGRHLVTSNANRTAYVLRLDEID